MVSLVWGFGFLCIPRLAMTNFAGFKGRKGALQIETGSTQIQALTISVIAKLREEEYSGRLAWLPGLALFCNKVSIFCNTILFCNNLHV
jgi:hypothetical protein